MIDNIIHLILFLFFFTELSGPEIFEKLNKLEKIEKVEKTEKKKYFTEFQEEKSGNTSADNYLKNLGIILLPKKFSNRNIFPKNERFASLDSFEIISEKEKFKNDYFNRKNKSDNERDVSDKNVNDSNDYNNNINNSCDDNNNNYNDNNNSNSNNINNSSLNNNNIDNNNSSSTRNSYQRSKHEEKTTYENINFNHLAIEKEEKQANNISAVNLIPKNKIDAQAIILLEIKRLSFSLKKLEKNKIKLELKVKFKMNKLMLFCV